MAWLHAVPDKPEGDKSQAPGRPRIKTLDDFGVEVELPGVSAPYLAEYLFEAGPSMPGDMGAQPLTSGELRAWQDGEGIPLSPWEFRVLRSLSKAYVAELYGAAKRGHPPPWRPDGWPESFHPDTLEAGRSLEDAIERDLED